MWDTAYGMLRVGCFVWDAFSDDGVLGVVWDITGDLRRVLQNPSADFVG